VKGIEVYKGKLVLYGCGDFLNDYEGIEGYEEFRGDLSLMYFASIDPATGQLHRLHMVPVTMRRFRITRASNGDAEWIQSTLQREGRYFGTSVKLEADDSGCALTLSWK
jgi:poly-gamma-glutamate synthesis protein (capsule biosynthesis protein)